MKDDLVEMKAALDKRFEELEAGLQKVEDLDAFKTEMESVTVHV